MGDEIDSDNCGYFNETYCKFMDAAIIIIFIIIRIIRISRGLEKKFENLMPDTF